MMPHEHKPRPDEDPASSRRPYNDEDQPVFNIDDASDDLGHDLGHADPSSSAHDEIERLKTELEDARSKYLRSMADFQNFQRRANQNEQVALQSGIASAVTKIVGVLDHFDMALNQDPAKASAEQIMDGVRVIREELIKAIGQSGVRVINPQPNDEFSPGIHEAIMQQRAEGVEPGHVVATYRAGYALGDRIIRAAQVAVAP